MIFPFLFFFTDVRKALKFDVNFDSFEAMSQTRDWLSQDEGLAFTEEMELKYGVHDFFCAMDTEFMAYTGGEYLLPDQDLSLMNEWRNFFSTHGLMCGPIETADFPKELM